MRKSRMVLAVAGVALLALGACGAHKGAPHLMNLHSSSKGPDEFALLPPKALALPEDLTALPDPTPGGENLTDQHPMDDAIVALGGKVPAVSGIPASDAGLVRYAGRAGGSADIRASLAADDLAWRKKHPGKLLERAFSLTIYFDVYKAMWLDTYAELQRWRDAGVRTPSAPPKDSGEPKK
jgi:hypothetical protein